MSVPSLGAGSIPHSIFEVQAPPRKRCGLLVEDYTHPTFRISAERVFAAAIKAGLPTKFDNRLPDFPARDQGDQSSCVAFATNNVAEVLEYRDTARLRTRLAPQYTYNLRDNFPEEGMYFSNLKTILPTYGVVTEARFPYGKKIGGKDTIPSDVIAFGKQHAMKDFAQIWGVDGLKAAVATNGGAIIALKVYNYSTHFWRPKDKNDEWTDSHAVAVVGYDDVRRAFILENSWGSDWGDHKDGSTEYTYDELDVEHNHLGVFTFVDVTGSPEITDPPLPPEKKGCGGCTLI